jgi:hypothetical protein
MLINDLTNHGFLGDRRHAAALLQAALRDATARFCTKRTNTPSVDEQKAIM